MGSLSRSPHPQFFGDIEIDSLRKRDFLGNEVIGEFVYLIVYGVGDSHGPLHALPAIVA